MFDIITIQESWLDLSVIDAPIVGNTNFALARKDRSESSKMSSTGGGTFIVVRNNIKFENITPDTRTLVELT